MLADWGDRFPGHLFASAVSQSLSRGIQFRVLQSCLKILSHDRFTKIIPAIVQDIINKQSLPLLNAEIGAKSETELSFNFETLFKIPGSMSARMDTMELYVYNKFTPGYYPYTEVTLPGRTLKGSTTISINESTPVLNDTEITKWLTKTL